MSLDCLHVQEGVAKCFNRSKVYEVQVFIRDTVHWWYGYKISINELVMCVDDRLTKLTYANYKSVKKIVPDYLKYESDIFLFKYKFTVLSIRMIFFRKLNPT